MNQFEFIPALIGQVQKDVGFSNQTGFFETAQIESQKIVEEKNLWIDVFYSETGVAEVRKLIQQFRQESIGEIKLRFLPNESFTPVSYPIFLTSVAILVIDDDFMERNILDRLLRCRKDQYKIIWVLDYTGKESMERELSLKFRRADRIIYKNMKTAPGAETVLTELNQALTPAEKEICIRLGMAQSLEPLIELMKETVSRENSILQTRKLTNSFDSQIIRKEETQNISTEITNYSKQLLQKNLIELEKSFRQKYEDLNKPNVGFFALSTTSFAEQINTLQYEELAEKSEKFQTTLPAQITESFLQENETALLREFNKDRAYVDTIISDIIQKINLLIQEKIKLTIPGDFSGIQLVSNERILKSSNYIQRIYQGETTKKGAMEYFVALRDYTGLMMVVVGLLAPLNMIASASDGTFGGPFAKFLKSIATWVKLGTAMITAALIVYGIHDLRKRIPRKRKEERDRETAKAKENIIQEGKRIYSEASRDWVQNITAWLKDVANQISLEVDKALRTVTDKKMQHLAQEKNTQSRNQMAIENSLKGIQNAERSLSSAVSKFQEAKQTLKLSK
ncbi:MAG: hypothetical protein IPP99_01510 [Chitinophagaceae bacterium]|nr:hypothetical protein [Chitinophagaceae bacterium]MBP6588473.1 hypothetical protein [Chitinophagaceae bacterium]